MKKFFLAMLIGLGSFISNETQAQVNVNVNIGGPSWLPSGYNRVNYYYLPDIDTYYYVPRRQYVYLNRGNWVRSSYAPARYRSYNFHRGRKVVIHGTPYSHYRGHKVKYKSYGRSHHPHHSKHRYSNSRSRYSRGNDRIYYERKNGRVYKRDRAIDRIIR